MPVHRTHRPRVSCEGCTYVVRHGVVQLPHGPLRNETNTQTMNPHKKVRPQHRLHRPHSASLKPPPLPSPTHQPTLNAAVVPRGDRRVARLVQEHVEGPAHGGVEGLQSGGGGTCARSGKERPSQPAGPQRQTDRQSAMQAAQSVHHLHRTIHINARRVTATQCRLRIHPRRHSR
jgi:hypothetical protein